MARLVDETQPFGDDESYAFDDNRTIVPSSQQSTQFVDATQFSQGSQFAFASQPAPASQPSQGIQAASQLTQGPQPVLNSRACDPAQHDEDSSCSYYRFPMNGNVEMRTAGSPVQWCSGPEGQPPCLESPASEISHTVHADGIVHYVIRKFGKRCDFIRKNFSVLSYEEAEKFFRIFDFS